MLLKDIIGHLIVLEKQNPNCKARLDVEVFNFKNESTFYDYGYDNIIEDVQPKTNIKPEPPPQVYYRQRKFTKRH